MPIQMPSNRLTLWAGVAVIVALLLWVLGPVLVPFAVAAVLAYALHPAVLRLQKTVPWIPQVVCVLLVELLALVAVLGVLLLLVPILTREIPFCNNSCLPCWIVWPPFSMIFWTNKA